jgi:hypothetical protein
MNMQLCRLKNPGYCSQAAASASDVDQFYVQQLETISFRFTAYHIKAKIWPQKVLISSFQDCLVGTNHHRPTVYKDLLS